MSETRPPRRLVLASTSPFRRELLERLGIPFETCKPEVDETAREGEPAHELVVRLSEAKARAARERFPDALIIGSDQVAVLDGRILTKPHTHENAVRQLTLASGRRVHFLTGLCLYDSAEDRALVDLVPYSVVFRQLSTARIEDYLRREQPYECAGSFKSEALGVALFERMEGDDPSALIGLPLIRLCGMLEQAEMPVLAG
jgi:MAF protein